MEELRSGLSSKRSRTGCVGCRQKKLRCDEQRPHCTRCTTKGEPCIYQPKLPLRERRSTLGPGQHSPWSFDGTQVSTDSPSRARRTVSSLTNKPTRDPSMSKAWHSSLNKSLNPFNTLPIDMPFKSLELLRYFFQTGQSRSFSQDEPRDSLHYAWNVGDLQLFESTFLFHKIQTIRQVNFWLHNSKNRKDRMMCTNYINTLSFIECCLGNFDIADSHLNGLMLYLDATRQSLDNDSTASKEAETEMIDRYIILVCNFVQSQKSRVDDFLRSHDIVASPFNSGDPLSLIHKWHHQEETGPEFRLRTVSMMPFFFAPTTWDIMPADIDARAIIDALKQTTYLHGLRYRNALADTVTNATWKVWKSGSALKLFSALINGHMEIFPDVAQSSSDESQDDEGRPVLSSWSGLCVGVGMYLATVLGMSNRGLPPVTQLHHHTLNILKRDMERGLRYLDKMSEEEQDLWFWKAFTGSLSLMHAQSLSYSKQLDKLLLEFTSYLRIWVARLGVTQWEEARTVLMRTAWPAFNFHDIKGN
ncbi:unnamed protein product [Fusarium graminearum]|uniref:Chromosome 2, complete genome n=1 Tax=Gibberella zeae (strain ATCC MYA-4620 / CBS 123657 / FGSC 9075 / NRRL 31084 / PH-1) TaxID=229533 RepID=A0A098DMY4_GIBZE|nr:unnamed protein product [Fusarium graminearum]CZS83123.1 unnamed protein product [Fusarium graminearum]